jgi:adenine-specific DNA-methyltransferase
MPTLNWIGKEKVINHHRDVPFKILEHKYSFSAKNGESEIPVNSGNKIIHGDNLEALKSLLPEYEGKIKCIYIDPPYNTGNENWVYNDNVNHPKIRKWLETTFKAKENGQEATIGIDDLARHDKWLCMMYPRLTLLYKLLAKDGFIAISIDDNELYNLGLVMNEIFGSNKRLACIPVKSEPSGGKGKDALRIGHEYLMVYYKENTSGLKFETKDVLGEILKDKKGEYTKGRELSKWGSESLRQDREEMWFPLIAPDGTEIYPIRNDGKEGRWRWGKKNPKIIEILKDPTCAHWDKRKFDEGIIVNGVNERWFPFEKIREKEKTFGWNTWLDTIGYNSEGTKEIKEIFKDKNFNTPKPTRLLEWIINLIRNADGIVLDSFAGSGTTAHAVLNLNNKDGGNRKFIMVEMEDYADSITSERVKRVIKGYADKEGTGGTFDYFVLGKPLFIGENNEFLNEEIGTNKIREYIWFSETRTSWTKSDLKKESQYFLGKKDGTAYYFIYEKDSLTTLDYDLLSTIKSNAGQYVIYADNCLLPKDFMMKHNILFKKIPRDITRF